MIRCPSIRGSTVFEEKGGLKMGFKPIGLASPAELWSN